MKDFKSLIGGVICIFGFITSVYAANPASKEYVDQEIKGLQTQINNIQSGTTSGTTYTAGTGISIAGNVITNSSPGTTYTAGTGISIAGSTISATGVGAAEFITTTNINSSVAPGAAFTFSTQVYNSVSSAIVSSAANSGTVFTLAAGTYIFDYEMSLGAAGSVGLYTGSSSSALTLDANTVAGSTTATTWIHGRAIEIVSSTPYVVQVSSVVGTAAVVTAGTDASSYMIRLTILKIA